MIADDYLLVGTNAALAGIFEIGVSVPGSSQFPRNADDIVRAFAGNETP